VPIVRAHHEKWDGSGYPAGLVGEAIPIGARILAAVDCLDALASDRQYRKALPLHEAMAKVFSEAGSAFDPRVVTILQNRYVAWEKLARSLPMQAPPKLSTDIKVERGLAPDAGFAQSAEVSPRSSSSVESGDRLSAARQQAQGLSELFRALNSSLVREDIFSLLAARLKQLVPYDSLVFYLRNGDALVPGFVGGDNFRLFSALQIPLGDGLSGWVAQNHKPILNGNPLVEPGYRSDGAGDTALRSALAVPLEGSAGVVAVLALYRAQQDGFTKDDLQVVETLSFRIGSVLEQASAPRATAAAVGGD
jgi:putative methionine-R-sulfoxide reductase with GAF domain